MGGQRFGVSLPEATKRIALADMIFGGLGVLGLAVHIYTATDILVRQQGRDSYSYYYDYSFVNCLYKWVPPFVTIIALASFFSQFVIGLILYKSIDKKSLRICYLHLVVTGLTAVFTGFLHRLYEMDVVYDYVCELKETEENSKKKDTPVDNDVNKGIEKEVCVNTVYTPSPQFMPPYNVPYYGHYQPQAIPVPVGMSLQHQALPKDVNPNSGNPPNVGG